ncbi:MAG TPA: M13 family metallopeptidase [Rhizomicrobium sp.]|nr:M13 family metallopeptidase [Rhizomicrobium sp.]
MPGIRVLTVAVGFAAAALLAGWTAGPVGRAGGIDFAGMDRAVKPGDDFFAYANGAWLRTAEIPADHSSYGVGAMLVEKTTAQLRQLIEAASKAGAGADPDTRKIGDYYASYMDETGIEAKGLAPLKPELDRIAAIRDTHGLSAYLGSTLRADVDALNSTNFYTDHLFGVWITQAFENPDRNVPYLLQGGLGMPDREYYLSTAARMAGIRARYQAHIAAMLKLAKIPDAANKAAAILALETKMAKAHWSRVDSEDVHKANNPWKADQFAARAPGLDWKAYFGAAGLVDQKDYIVWQPSAVRGLSALAASEPLTVWKDYLAFHFIEHHAPVLPKAFVDENFAFNGTVLAGTPSNSERWKRAVDATNAALGEAVGKLYVAQYFPPLAKARIEALVHDLLVAYHARISNLKWMSPATREKALAKLATLKVGVGYPDKWRDYSALHVIRDDALGNLERAELFEYRRNLAKLKGPVDRDEWVMTPQTVNAVNLPMANALNFPAAILQPPYFDPKADAALNFGATGATIGHEISHSFDDEGSQFDAQGRLENWWTPADFAHFKAASAKLAAEFDSYRPFPDLAVNGQQTLSENIADVAGLSASHDAYIASLGGTSAPVIDGLSGDQRFFLAYAQSWRTKIREAALRRRILTDGHAPPEYRADTVRNLDAWYPAFAGKPGEKLYLSPADRVQVW